MIYKVIEKGNRSSLSEGVRWGMGFTFLNKLDKTTFESLTPFSTCKDYLNDIVYNEVTGKQITIYGLSLINKTGIFDKKNVYLGFKMLPTYPKYTGAEYQPNRTLDNDNAQIENNLLNMFEFIHRFEDLLKINKNTTVSIGVDDSKNPVYILNISKDWIKTTYMISLYSHLLRTSLWYDGSMDLIAYLELTKKDLHNQNNITTNIIEKLKYIYDTGNVEFLKKQDLKNMNLVTNSQIHSMGICSLKIN